MRLLKAVVSKSVDRFDPTRSVWFMNTRWEAEIVVSTCTTVPIWFCMDWMYKKDNIKVLHNPLHLEKEVVDNMRSDAELWVKVNKSN